MGMASAGPQGCHPRSSRQDMKGRLSQGRQAGGAYGKEADVWEGRPSGMWRELRRPLLTNTQDEDWPEGRGSSHRA